jgi:hypothetical protein
MANNEGKIIDIATTGVSAGASEPEVISIVEGE